MSFFLDSIEYIISLREKGWGDEGFYIEYDFICHEVYDFKNLENPKCLT